MYKGLLKRVAGMTLTGIALLGMSGVSFADADTDLLIHDGKIVFEETAGGVGCAACHGMAATGDPDAQAPYVRGASKAMLDSALAGGVPVMEFIDLDQHERQAVIAYLQYLKTAESSMLDPIAEAGRKIFEETAGGVGCASCHGTTAEGDIGPDIRGRNSTDILEQLRVNDQMKFINLTQEEVDQVSAYLSYLHDLEAH